MNTDAERHERMLRAVELRRKGKNYREISEELGVSIGTAFNDVWKHFGELAKLATEELEQVRALELARLDRWLEGLTAKAEEGNLMAIQTGIRLMERRAKLLGLDAPVKHEVEQARDDFDKMNRQERIAELRKALAEEEDAAKGEAH